MYGSPRVACGRRPVGMGDVDMQTIESQVGTEGWPAEVLALFDSIEHAFPPVMQRRQVARTPYKREGHFTLIGEGQAFAVYTRDANLWTVGFIAGRRIETNARGVLKLIAPDG